MTFKQLEISEPIMRALEKVGYSQPTKIQEEVIPLLLNGRDVLASSQTGTGKTAAYTIPVLQKLSTPSTIKTKRRDIRALILSPTRELAAQISQNISLYSQFLKLKHAVIFGGVPQSRQINSMRNGVDILVATPGRLIDLCNQHFIDLSTVEILILDEADQMLDMGFLPDMKKIIAKCENRNQTMMFSATIPARIKQLSIDICNNPVRVAVVPVNQPLDSIEQSIYKLENDQKKKLLVHLLEQKEYDSVLVFTRTKYSADKLSKMLRQSDITCEVIHGNKSQNARTHALERFKNGKSRVLLATDIVARGIDVKNLSLVINYDLPEQNEVYIHRMGRTGRAGFDGKVISFCSRKERGLLADIEKYIGMSIHEEKLPKNIISNKKESSGKTPRSTKDNIDSHREKKAEKYYNRSAHFKNKDFEIEGSKNKFSKKTREFKSKKKNLSSPYNKKKTDRYTRSSKNFSFNRSRSKNFKRVSRKK